MVKELKEMNITVYEEDGSVFAEIDGKTELLVSDKNINLKTEVAFENIKREIYCILECFHERSNIECLTNCSDDEKDFKKGRNI